MQVQEEMMRKTNLHSGAKRKNGFIVANMHYQALFTAINVGIFTVGLHGTIGGKTFHGLVVLHTCGIWVEEKWYSNHLEGEFAGCEE